MTEDKNGVRRRQLARVVGSSFDEDRNTLYVMLELEAGMQGFGGICFGSDGAGRAKFLAAVRRVLCVPPGSDIVGAMCYALRPRGDWGETIEGIESLDGAHRLTLTGYVRSLGVVVKSTLDQEREFLESTVRWAERRAAEARAALETLDARTHDWGDGNVTAEAP